ncbi:EI24 domain-containing protein [Bdellovibrio bacteriovorus]|uniref:EI24 domain-containing protein n=1 Tax=Bdellovibrio bacteriovorus TaxID=959 RepID=UPI0009BD865B|nr:EI24 domain-containing protein [Bdellovibrio bacteriovorus]
MNSILTSLHQSLKALARPRMALLIFLPPVLSFVFLFALFVSFWPAWISGLTGFFSSLTAVSWMTSITGLTDFAYWCSVVFLILLFIPMVFLFAVVMTSLFVMPIVLKWVGDVDFRGLEKKKGGTLIGSVWNTLSATLIFLMLFVVTLPLWFLPGLQIVVPLMLASWLNKKVFLYDVLQDYASKDERHLIAARNSKALYGLGLLLGLLSYIPLAFFFVPVLLALSYTYYCLNALQSLRKGES